MTFTPKWDAVSNHVFQHYLSVNEAFDLGLLLHKKNILFGGDVSKIKMNGPSWKKVLECAKGFCSNRLKQTKGKKGQIILKKNPFFL